MLDAVSQAVYNRLSKSFAGLPQLPDLQPAWLAPCAQRFFGPTPCLVGAGLTCWPMPPLRPMQLAGNCLHLSLDTPRPNCCRPAAQRPCLSPIRVWSPGRGLRCPHRLTPGAHARCAGVCASRCPSLTGDARRMVFRVAALRWMRPAATPKDVGQVGLA